MDTALVDSDAPLLSTASPIEPTASPDPDVAVETSTSDSQTANATLEDILGAPPSPVADASPLSVVDVPSEVSEVVSVVDPAVSEAVAPAAAAASADSVPTARDLAATAEKSGWVQKNSFMTPNLFNTYFFVLSDNQLRYYVSEESTSVKGVIQLEGSACEIVPESKYGLSGCFELNSPLQSRLFALACDSQATMQSWINVLRACMLKIRRVKAKEAAARKRQAVEGAAQESQAAQAAHREQQHALANAALTTQSSTPLQSQPSTSQSYADSYRLDRSQSSVAAPSSSSYAAQPAVGSSYTRQPSHSYNSRAGGGGMPQSSEDKYSIYRQWLDETKSSKSTGGGDHRPTRPSVGGGDLHHTLLDEDQRKNTSFWAKCCSCLR